MEFVFYIELSKPDSETEFSYKDFFFLWYFLSVHFWSSFSVTFFPFRL